MSWIRTALFAGLGMSIGGPIGAVIGALAGGLIGAATDVLDKMQPPEGKTPMPKAAAARQNQVIFFTCLFSMLGKMAKSDGVVCRDEITMASHFMRQLRLDADDTKMAQRIFNAAKSSEHDIYQYADQYAKIANKEMRAVLYEMLWRLAAADGKLHGNEEDILRKIGKRLKIGDSYFNIFHAELFSHSAVALADSYALLGCDEKTDNAGVKLAYRRAVAQYHPDRIQSRGLPESFMSFANEQTQKINVAYDAIMKAREAG